MRLAFFVASFLALLFLMACGHEPPGENHGNLFASPNGIILIENEHQVGWGRSDCFSCHAQKNLHRQNTSGVQGLDLEAIRGLVQDGGESICASCHGSNGT